ncbi:hypothetical protein [Mesorhizobium sp. CN2-181]|uniref:hypothetical protein n=1 Tax=Mesorhizobium yinganensis TaxID=3157707 RepID=UPI0032B758D5
MGNAAVAPVLHVGNSACSFVPIVEVAASSLKLYLREELRLTGNNSGFFDLPSCRHDACEPCRCASLRRWYAALGVVNVGVLAGTPWGAANTLMINRMIVTLDYFARRPRRPAPRRRRLQVFNISRNPVP